MITPGAKFLSIIHDNSVEISLQQKRGILGKLEKIPFAKWSEALAEQGLPTMAVISQLVEDFHGESLEDKVILPHEAITGLSETQAYMLGLPPAVPYAFDIKTSGMIDQSDFRLTTSWVNAGGVREFGLESQGAFVLRGDNIYRVPSPIFEIMKAAEVLSNTQINDNAVRYQALAALYELLPQDKSEKKVLSDSYLGSIRVLHAAAFSLQIPLGGDGFQFNPVLFSRKAVGRAQEDGRIIDEAESLLTDNLQATFSNNRFKNWPDVRDCYAVDKGIYVYLDPDLKKALGVVRRMQQAEAEERKKFIRAPQRYIYEQLGESYALEAVERLFVETEQYADNVTGMGLWEPPVLPWIIKQPNSWLPEKFGIKIGDIYIQIDHNDLQDLRQKIEEAHKNGVASVDYGENKIPATTQVIDVLGQLSGIAVPEPITEKEALLTKDEKEKKIKERLIHFLVVEDNFEELRYQSIPIRRVSSPNYALPSVLKTSLKPHQEVGLKWLIDSWSEGLPGVLLADDMGLGKTLQALTFLAWIKERKQEKHSQCKEPVLIIAPTGLLNNWKREIDIHLHQPGLGELCLVYGKNLAYIRAYNQNDLNTGQTNLSREKLRQADVVLTTYETYRDYHHSFGGIRFSAVILDESQKIKNPKSQVNRALASMNAHFVVAMTGTPVENAIEDLWTIMDRVWPGYLGDLKQFSSTYRPDDHQALAELTRKLKSPCRENISVPVLFRRMKDEILDGLPKKYIHLERVEMPRKQADAYLEVVNKAKALEPPPMLHTLHCLRGISLHPTDPNLIMAEASLKSFDSYISESARLIRAFQVLDRVQELKEKALIFIESIDMQFLMAEIIKKRYSLPKRPSIINGKTGVDRIQKAVDDFQADSNFDVMILSPKVGGVGLTLTAANHVIHLSRWWNPAVEDQSTDRVYRIGQEKEVHVYYLIAVHPDTHVREHSFDLKLNALLERKRQLSRDMLLPAESGKETEGLFNETVGFTDKRESITPEELDSMEPIMFEQWVLNRARQSGYQADSTKQSHDFGADGIIVHKETKQKFILQCKHSIGERIGQDKVIEDLLRARTAYDRQGNAGLVALTNSHFAPYLMRRMDQMGIKYFDRDTIIHWPKL